VTQIINIADYRKPVQNSRADDVLTTRDLWNKIRRDMVMGVTVSPPGGAKRKPSPSGGMFQPSPK